MEYAYIYVTLAVIFGLFMAWGVGANDVANAMATSVGSKAITLKQAIIIAAIFEFTGAFLAGGGVTKTIRKGIIDPEAITAIPNGQLLLIYGMLASLLAAGIWLMLATRKGWPVSTTHSIVGAIVGFAAVGIGVEAVQWGKVGFIVASWVISPLLAGVVAFFLFISVQRLILDTDDPLKSAKKYVPFYIFLVGFIISSVTIFKGLKHLDLHFTLIEGYALAFIIGIVMMFVGKQMVNKVQAIASEEKSFHFASVEKVFAVLMMVTACAMAFAHGSNDVANAIGPVASVIDLTKATSSSLSANVPLPPWVLLIGGAGIVLGLLTYGYKVIDTVGRGITELTPSRGFAATLAAAITVVVASATKLPISTTHTLVGAVLGVGFARGLAAVNLRVVRTIFMSWIVTLPAGAVLAIMFFFMLKGIFL
ncbi:Probable low-affinity inorganic phosphate transporter [hydrothermal vent metagenome]|uniref:Probable low-affinity inorganic phosphate transporter n=1 Tax=hydrothermal vent metagenome TaxID=652676 RepID=A0A3B0YGB6_9ZZZZ